MTSTEEIDSPRIRLLLKQILEQVDTLGTALENFGSKGSCSKGNASDGVIKGKTSGDKKVEEAVNAKDDKNGFKDSSSVDKSVVENRSFTDSDAPDLDFKDILMDTDDKVEKENEDDKVEKENEADKVEKENEADKVKKENEALDEKTGNDMAKENPLKDALCCSGEEVDDDENSVLPKSEKNNQLTEGDKSYEIAESKITQESGSEDSSSDESEPDKKSTKKKSKKKDKLKESDPESEMSSDSDFVVPKKKLLKIKDKLLTTPLCEKKKKMDVNAEEKKQDTGGKRAKRRKVMISDNQDDGKNKFINLSSSSDTNESSSREDNKLSKKKQGKKRERIKVVDPSEEISSDGNKKVGSNKGRTPKFNTFWESPYQIVKRINDWFYRIRKEQGGNSIFRMQMGYSRLSLFSD